MRADAPAAGAEPLGRSNWAKAPNLEAKKATGCQAQGRCRVPHFPRPKAA